MSTPTQPPASAASSASTPTPDSQPRGQHVPPPPVPPVSTKPSSGSQAAFKQVVQAGVVRLRRYNPPDPNSKRSKARALGRQRKLATMSTTPAKPEIRGAAPQSDAPAPPVPGKDTGTSSDHQPPASALPSPHHQALSGRAPKVSKAVRHSFLKELEKPSSANYPTYAMYLHAFNGWMDYKAAADTILSAKLPTLKKKKPREKKQIFKKDHQVAVTLDDGEELVVTPQKSASYKELEASVLGASKARTKVSKMVPITPPDVLADRLLRKKAAAKRHKRNRRERRALQQVKTLKTQVKQVKLDATVKKLSAKLAPTPASRRAKTDRDPYGVPLSPVTGKPDPEWSRLVDQTGRSAQKSRRAYVRAEKERQKEIDRVAKRMEGIPF